MSIKDEPIQWVSYHASTTFYDFICNTVQSEELDPLELIIIKETEYNESIIHIKD